MTLPSDCKVAFGYDGEDEALWEKWGPKHGQEQPGKGKYRLPKGWSLNETDGGGARMVAVFRVEGDLRIEDGKRVAHMLSLIEKMYPL